MPVSGLSMHYAMAHPLMTGSILPVHPCKAHLDLQAVVLCRSQLLTTTSCHKHTLANREPACLAALMVLTWHIKISHRCQLCHHLGLQQ